MIAYDCRSPLDLLHIGLVVRAQIIAVVHILVIERRPHSANEKVEGTADVVHEIHHPFSAAIFYRSFVKIVANRKNSTQ